MNNTNRMRARRALKAVNLYRRALGLKGARQGEALEEGLVDLLTDLRHLAAEKATDYGTLDYKANWHYTLERHTEPAAEE